MFVVLVPFNGIFCSECFLVNVITKSLSFNFVDSSIHRLYIKDVSDLHGHNSGFKKSLILYLSNSFPDDFMVTVISFKSF